MKKKKQKADRKCNRRAFLMALPSVWSSTSFQNGTTVWQPSLQTHEPTEAFNIQTTTIIINIFINNLDSNVKFGSRWCLPLNNHKVFRLVHIVYLVFFLVCGSTSQLQVQHDALLFGARVFTNAIKFRSLRWIAIQYVWCPHKADISSGCGCCILVTGNLTGMCMSLYLIPKTQRKGKEEKGEERSKHGRKWGQKKF